SVVVGVSSGVFATGPWAVGGISCVFLSGGRSGAGCLYEESTAGLAARAFAVASVDPVRATWSRNSVEQGLAPAGSGIGGSESSCIGSDETVTGSATGAGFACGVTEINARICAPLV